MTHFLLHAAVGFLLVAAGRSRRPFLTAGCIAAAGAAVARLHVEHHGRST